LPRRLFHLFILILISAAGTRQSTAAEFAPISAEDQQSAMHRGMNVMDGDPAWDGGAAWFRPEQFGLIRGAGFDTVRINLHMFPHADKSGRLDARYLATLDRYVDAALNAGLTTVLDEHDDNSCDGDLADCRIRLPAVWGVVASRYRNRSNKLLFEILNEPHGAVTAPVWGTLFRSALNAVRATNPERNVVIGPAGYNSVEQLPTLDLPARDQHIIVTVHYYWPERFTHQGVPWVADLTYVHGITFGSDEQKLKIRQDFDRVRDWGKAHNRPILLGEFGAYENGDLASRVTYISTVARMAEAHGLAWAFWEFETDFAAYDMKRDAWNTPILKALVPQENNVRRAP
jgi:endoglucanase